MGRYLWIFLGSTVAWGFPALAAKEEPPFFGLSALAQEEVLEAVLREPRPLPPTGETAKAIQVEADWMALMQELTAQQLANLLDSQTQDVKTVYAKASSSQDAWVRNAEFLGFLLIRTAKTIGELLLRDWSELDEKRVFILFRNAWDMQAEVRSGEAQQKYGFAEALALVFALHISKKPFEIAIFRQSFLIGLLFLSMLASKAFILFCIR